MTTRTSSFCALSPRRRAWRVCAWATRFRIRQITRHLRVAATPFAVSALAERAAVASIEHQEAVMARVRHIVAERERVTARLRELGYEFPGTYANFVWLPLGERTGDFR